MQHSVNIDNFKATACFSKDIVSQAYFLHTFKGDKTSRKMVPNVFFW